MERDASSHFAVSPAIRRRLNRYAGCGLALAILLMSGACQATTYRWKDVHGKVHYGDSIPSDYSSDGYQILDSQGHVTRRIEGYSSKATDKETQARQAANDRAAKDQQRHDNALLSTYDNTKEIDQARGRRLADEQALLDNAILLRKQKHDEAETARLDAKILQYKKDMDETRTQFDADKVRFQELNGKP
jgi:hypothetical protein